MTTIRRVTRELRLSEPAEIDGYEAVFYAAFEQARHNRLVRWLWDWDHARRRLRTRIPYSDQRIWGMQSESGGLAGGIAVNVALRELQAAAYEFVLPGELAAIRDAGRLCEFLTLFSAREQSMRRMASLWREVFGDLRSAGFTHAVATTSPKVMPLYRWAGAHPIGETQVQGETRIFLAFDLLHTRR